MSKYLPLYVSIWSDFKFENYNSQKKLLFIFLVTNQFVERSGIYKITTKQISFYTGLTIEVINEFINELIDEDKIKYNFNDGTIFLKNIFRYQKGLIKNEKILLLTMKRNFELVKTDYWNDFFEIYKNDPITAKIKALLIDESLMVHQLYINKNKNNNINKNINNNKKIKKESTNCENNFEDFWKNYNPVKTSDGSIVERGSKKLAKIAYEKCLKKYSAEQIFSGTQQYLLDCHKNNRLTCHASTMLNQERFVIEKIETLDVK